MADHEVGNFLNVTDKRSGRGTNGVTVLAEAANATSISAMRTRLAALDASAYSAARLNAMTKNDLAYALRLKSADSAGI